MITMVITMKITMPAPDDGMNNLILIKTMLFQPVNDYGKNNSVSLALWTNCD